MTEVELIIVGGGPAGLTSAIYSARALIDTLVIEKMLPGGQPVLTTFIENYPGFPEGISGPELAERLEAQAGKFGAKIITSQPVLNISRREEGFEIKTEMESFLGKAVIVATGTSPRKLNVPGEEEFTGRGVSYCAVCDGAFYRDRVVAVVGGGDSAMDESIYLTRFASKVFVIHRRNQLRAEKILQERAFSNPKISFIWDTVVQSIEGDRKVELLKLKNVKTGEISELKVDGIFVYIGSTPNSSMVKDLVDLDENGFIITDNCMKTSVPGLFAAGDVRNTNFRQLATAIGDGAIAANSAERYLGELSWKV
ncbi:MAG TPA: thioredoxin-disulfide reductase [bacterium]|nr:thioredoxin-disulfide reductase [bacterium]HPO81400.1 thioredoxin-disulfide reductase [bacterium]